VRIFVIRRVEDAVTRFTLKRIETLIAGILIAIVVISVIFVNWYAALTALGVGSIIIGLAVQTPIKSFIGGSLFWSASLIASAIGSRLLMRLVM
jgi:small-conductance mechanosensitive channel